MKLFRLAVCSLLLLLTCRSPLSAREATPFRFTEGKHGQGALKYVNDIPVLTVAGTPEEIGEQIGRLTNKAAGQLGVTLKDYLKQKGLSLAWPVLVSTAKSLLPQIPEDHRKELEAIAKASGQDFELLLVANTISDYLKFGGCSTLIVQGTRSAAGGPLFGRNLDLPPVGILPELSLVTIYKPKGKRAFASIGFPGLLCTGSLINDAGLAIAANEVTKTGDGSAKFDRKGVPSVVGLRRLAEECTTVDDVEKLLRATKRTTMGNLTVCDPQGGAVFELTTANVVRRNATAGYCCCTNHFCDAKLATATKCPRFEVLEKWRQTPKFGLSEIARIMDDVNQGQATLQTMIFEPAALRLHVALGRGPTSKLPLKKLELTSYFKK